LLSDITHGFRMLLRSPAFTAVALITLALGIGVNTAIFSVVNAALLRPLPFQEPDSLVVVQETVGKTGLGLDSYPNFLDWRSQNQVFEGIAAYATNYFSVAGPEQAERVLGEYVSDGYFELLGAAPAAGRAFLPAENSLVSPDPVVVISHAYWKDHFGLDSTVAGRTLKIEETDFTIIGVAAAGFTGFSGRANLWVPMAAHDLTDPSSAKLGFLADRGIHWHRVVGRLKQGVTLEQARAEMAAMGSRLRTAYPGENNERGVMVIEARESVAGAVRSPLYLLLGAVGFVLLISCTNVANLLLVRAAAREKEIAIRLALGAGRQRLMSQLLGEGMTIGLAAGGGGLLLAFFGTGILATMLPLNLPALSIVTVDSKVMTFTVALSMLTGVVLGLAPYLQSRGLDLIGPLKGNDGHGARKVDRLRNTLVIFEIAIALVLTIGAGLMLQTFLRISRPDLGFKPEHLLTLRVDIPNSAYQGAERFAAPSRLASSLQSIPGVEAAAATQMDPYIWPGINRGFSIEGQPAISADEQDSVYFQEVTPNFVGTMEVPILSGRDFSNFDNQQAPAVAMVSEAFARRYWSGRDPIGGRIKLGARDGTGRLLSVVGVARDVKSVSLRESPISAPIVYTPLLQSESFNSVSLIVRAAGNPLALIPSIRGKIAQFDSTMPVYSVAAFPDRIGDKASLERSSSILIGIFAGLALALSSLGIYSVLAYTVTLRVREFGIRIALGASHCQLTRLVLRGAVLLILPGIGIGVVTALALTRLVSSLLYGISATDPATFAGLSITVALVALLASYLPARRAARVDPMVALRYE
jgi:predicted permease